MNSQDDSNGNNEQPLIDADSRVDALVAALTPHLGELERLRSLAKKMGVFTGDRELLQCPRCELTEDVLVNGRLITYVNEQIGVDCGLRFEELSDGRFRCPACGLELDPLL